MEAEIEYYPTIVTAQIIWFFNCIQLDDGSKNSKHFSAVEKAA